MKEKISDGNKDDDDDRKSAILVVEHVKCRSLPDHNGRSPLGVLYVFADRVLWRDNSSASIRVDVSFHKIRGQRVSPPNKSLTQLQLCLHEGNGDPVTLAFANPVGGTEANVRERDMVKDTLQQLLIKHRQAASSAVGDKLAKDREHESRKRILIQNPHLQALYRHLVTTNFISPADFWMEHAEQKDDASDQRTGVSGGFLSSLAQNDGCNGVKLNLTVETQQAIFRVYPAVGRKHFELVPHEMTEQVFWQNFFQSHYFHRDRTIANAAPSDVFADCLKSDTADMKAIVDAGVITHRNVDLNSVEEDLGIFANQDADFQSRTNSNNTANSRAMLVKRFNYHSGRVLDTLSMGAVGTNSGRPDGATSSKQMRIDDEMELLLESRELAEDDVPTSGETLSDDAFRQSVRLEDCYSADNASRLKRKMIEFAQNSSLVDDPDSELSESNAEYAYLQCIPDNHSSTTSQNNTSVTSNNSIREIEELHDALTELLRHFWCCFPPQTALLEEKLERMIGALRKFEETQLRAASRKLVVHYNLEIEYLNKMLKLAYDRYEEYEERKRNGHKR